MKVVLDSPRREEIRRTYTLKAVGNSAAEFAEFVKADRANAGRVFRMMGIGPSGAPS